MELKRQIARRTLGLPGGMTFEDVIPTNGCLEAVGLCLRAVAGPGDTVLVESPTFHGFLQLIEDLNMYALEVPTHPDTGVDPGLLEKAVRENRVRACLLTPHFQNPLGALMPDENKEAIVHMMNRRSIPIIEDDIYGEFSFGKTRSLPLIAYDRKGLVLYCSSFSKTLAPGLRVGWTLPGRFGDKVKRLKLNMNLGSAGLNQAVVAEFIKSGAFDRHLRRLGNMLKNQMANTARVVAETFPKGTRITAPRGGLLLWVQLHPSVDSMVLYGEARKRNISIMPGAICSASDKYNHFIRISCGHPWTDRVEQGIAALGKTIRNMMEFETKRENHIRKA
jgi:DNA-binding transcriptional MocR family regulator